MPCAPLLAAKDLVGEGNFKNDCFTSVIENRPSTFLSYKIFNNKLKPLFINKVNRDTCVNENIYRCRLILVKQNINKI